MGLLKFILERKILVGLITVLVLIIGLFAIYRLDQELLPPVKMDGAYVDVIAGDLAATEVESSITEPVEKAVAGLDGIKNIHSTSAIGRSTMEITWEEGLGEKIYPELESLIHSVLSNDPNVQEIMTGQYSTSSAYEFYYDLSGSDMSDVTAFAEDILEPRLEELPEVGDVALQGALEEEIMIRFDYEKIQNSGIDPIQAISTIREENTETTLGEFTDESTTQLLRWNAASQSVKDIEQTRISSNNGLVQLKDIADVTIEPQDTASYVWKNGSNDFIFIQIGRSPEATQVEMANAVRSEIEKMREEKLLDGYDLNEVVAQADYVEEALNGVTSNVLIGGILSIIILLMFWRNLRATIIIGVSIPTSILLTFISMWLLDYSFNILSLIALGLGIGMMVDSSIVILESIIRKKEQGLSHKKAVIQGTKEVSTAVIASVLTTIAVFVPVSLLSGDMGSFMIILAIVVAITLISSVIVAFTIIPALADKLLVNSLKKQKEKDNMLVTVYRQSVSWIVRKKRNSLILITTFTIIFISSLLLITKIPMTIMPDVYNRYAEVMIELEPGLTKNDKEKIINAVDQSLNSIEDVENNYVLDEGGVIYSIINMTKGENVTRSQAEVNEEIIRSLNKLKDTLPVTSVESATSVSGVSTIELLVKGEKFEEIQSVSSLLMKELENLNGVVEVSSSMERTSKQEKITVNDSNLLDAGLTAAQVKQITEQAFLNMPFGELAIESATFPLTASWKEPLTTKDELLDLPVTTINGSQPLSDFITITEEEAPNQISHTDGTRYAMITATTGGRDLGSINREVQQIISNVETPDGYNIELAGDLDEQQKLMQDMLFILGIAIFLVYLVMAVQFNHLFHPLIVMSVIPMTLVGVILGLLLTQQELSIMSGMGIIMLIGIVLNNAILLIDRTKQLRKTGMSVPDALVEAGRNRMRPIFMTAFTTVGGMLPLAVIGGAGSDYQAPMATAIISGLLFATLITLFLIPAVYRLFSKKERNSQKDNTTEIIEDSKSVI
ncbi:hydrophobic/amphiphilic exporter-1, HAE1 family [Gracilibacillus ureilyticus]|uniref:Hydrophobic/amphiphilic exporter-1, HAE1 family n=1 Tax=Gracilibacillus ureilyticus TaxID=531814 RepID=A0A1H9Q7Z9_9BACI|nr:efflux RND transporter permease subunit [Gracilibacillus ureilyticus]SER56574.1 hydrophobic/amphiphilic exporter-1, HAE1 family [Gracilibacillus ureilyticus]